MRIPWLPWVAALALAPTAARAQSALGHKLPGAVGLDAGTQPDPGLYLVSRFVYYDALRLRDREGDRVPLPGFDATALAGMIGLGATLRLESGLHLGFAVAAPIARLSLTAGGEQNAELDRSGLADVFVKPLQVGARWSRLDLLGSYAFYAPTRQFGRQGLGSPQWSHQLSAGGTLWLGPRRAARLSTLFSVDLYHRKLDADVTRGPTVLLQGGVGGTLARVLELGLAYYALWQVADDRGPALPPALRGRRDRVFGLGPELNLIVPPLRAQLGVRYMRDLGARGRPEGQLLVTTLSFRPWAFD